MLTFTRFQFKSWPRSSVPSVDSLLGFVEKFHEIVPPAHLDSSSTSQSTSVSGDSSRSGVFIALNCALQELKSGRQHIDVYWIVRNMWLNRHYMVQNWEQYAFLHKCIDKFIKDEKKTGKKNTKNSFLLVCLYPGLFALIETI